MPTRYVVCGEFGISVGEQSSPEAAVEFAKHRQLHSATGMYRVESYDEETGEYQKDIYIYADGSRREG